MATDWDSALLSPFLSQHQEDEARILTSEWEAKGNANNILLAEPWSDDAEDEFFGAVSLSPDSGLTSHSSSSPEFHGDSPEALEFIPSDTSDILSESLLADVKPILAHDHASFPSAAGAASAASAAPNSMLKTKRPRVDEPTVALGAQSKGFVSVRKDLPLKSSPALTSTPSHQPSPQPQQVPSASGVAVVPGLTAGLAAKPLPLGMPAGAPQVCSGSLFLQSLSTEERVMMEAEGVPVPKEGPLTKNEERELKRLRRKIKNKLSAKDSRRRRKEYLTTLEEENEDLKRQLDEMKESSHSLARQLSCMYNYIAPSFEGKSKPQTAVMMLLMLTLTTSAAQSTQEQGVAVDSAAFPNVPQHTLLPEASSAEPNVPLDESFTSAFKTLVTSSGVLSQVSSALNADAVRSSSVSAVYLPRLAGELRADVAPPGMPDDVCAAMRLALSGDDSSSRKRKAYDDDDELSISS